MEKALMLLYPCRDPALQPTPGLVPELCCLCELGSHRGICLGMLWGWQDDSWECKWVLLEATEGCLCSLRIPLQGMTQHPCPGVGRREAMVASQLDLAKQPVLPQPPQDVLPEPLRGTRCPWLSTILQPKSAPASLRSQAVGWQQWEG